MYNDFYLIKRIDKKEETGLAMASAIDDFSYKGEIVRTPVHFIKDSPEIGEKILFMKNVGEDVTLEGVNYKVVAGEDLIMKL